MKPLTRERLAAAAVVCTQKDLELLACLAHTNSVRGAARMLGITRDAARRRLERAQLRIDAYLEATKETAA